MICFQFNGMGRCGRDRMLIVFTTTMQSVPIINQ